MWKLPIHLRLDLYKSGLILAAVGSGALAGGVCTAEARDFSVTENFELAAKRKVRRVRDNRIKERYWSQDSRHGVTQKRLFKKTNRMELQLLGGATFSDPFLNVQQAGLSLGYHLNEYVSLSALGWFNFTQNSSALDSLEKDASASTDKNPPQGFGGLEAAFSVIYGKLSWLQSRIWYFDLHMMGGLGLAITENGSYFAQHGGVGQQIWLNRFMAAKVSYRIVHYVEGVVGKNPKDEENFGKDRGTRQNWGNVLSLGISFIL